MKEAWILFCQIFTALSVIVLLLYVLPFPFFDHSGTTLMAHSPRARIITAKALSRIIGDPVAELNTHDVWRYLFKDGTSVDSLVHVPNFTLMYDVIALKQIVLNLFSWDSPVVLAKRITESLESDGSKSQTITQPDSASPDGSVVLILSDAFRYDNGSGYAIIVRKHAFRIGGQHPIRFIGWPR